METPYQPYLFLPEPMGTGPLNESRYLVRPTLLLPLPIIRAYEISDFESSNRGFEMSWKRDEKGFKGGKLAFTLPPPTGKYAQANAADFGVRMWIKIEKPGNRLGGGEKEGLVAFLTGIAIFEAAGSLILPATGGRLVHSEKAMPPSVPLFEAQVALGNYKRIPFEESGFLIDDGQGYYVGLFPQNDIGLQNLVVPEAVEWLVEIAKNRIVL